MGKFINLIMRCFIDNNVCLYFLVIECVFLLYFIFNGLALILETKFFFGDEVIYMCNFGYVINGIGLVIYKIIC